MFNLSGIGRMKENHVCPFFPVRADETKNKENIFSVEFSIEIERCCGVPNFVFFWGWGFLSLFYSSIRHCKKWGLEFVCNF